MGCCVALHSGYPSNQSLIEHLDKATIELVEEGDGEFHTYCSAFWVSEYYIGTARHCVAEEDDSVKLGSIKTFLTYDDFSTKLPRPTPKHLYSAIVVDTDKDTDVAILKSIDDVTHDILKIRKGDVPVGLDAHTMGHPAGMTYSYITGVVSQIRDLNIPEIGKKVKTIHLTSLIWKGNSGCAAVDGDGNIIGVASFLLASAPGMSFFVHKNELVKLLDKNNIKYY
jgi:S1-C subfamily serine protease